MAVETRGIRHVHLLVLDHTRSVAFYGEVFGMQVAFRHGSILFLNSPEKRDDLALHLAQTEEEKVRVGQSGGYEHFGITVTDRTRLDEVIAMAQSSGGSLIAKGQYAPGVPYAYVSDPDGYVIEI